MRNRIFGAIGFVWGGWILLNVLSGGMDHGADSAYRTGQYLGIALGALMFTAGLYYLIRGDGGGPKKKKKKKRTLGR